MKHKKGIRQSRDYQQKNQELRAEIEHTRSCIDSARNHFEQAVEPTLIDCYIFELKCSTAALSISAPAIQKPGIVFRCSFLSIIHHVLLLPGSCRCSIQHMVNPEPELRRLNKKHTK